MGEAGAPAVDQGLSTYGKLPRGRVSGDNEGVSGCVQETRDSPGTTSRASMASLYSTKPKPFMSLISVISPVPWLAKWFSTSAFVARARIRLAGWHYPGRACAEGAGGVQGVSRSSMLRPATRAEAYHCAGDFPDRVGSKTRRP
jgi:hypothetical protein